MQPIVVILRNYKLCNGLKSTGWTIFFNEWMDYHTALPFSSVQINYTLHPVPCIILIFIMYHILNSYSPCTLYYIHIHLVSCIKFIFTLCHVLNSYSPYIKLVFTLYHVLNSYSPWIKLIFTLYHVLNSYSPCFTLLFTLY